MLFIRLLCLLGLWGFLSGLTAADQPTGTAPVTAPETTVEITAGAVATTPVSPASPAAKRIAYVQIDGVIDPHMARYFRRAVEDAISAKVDAIVTHLTTPGGRVDSAEEMTKIALSVPENGPLMVAYVDDHSYSAGALIAYAHQRIYLTDRANLGNIGVILQTADGKIEYGPEKAETVIRALLRSVAQKNGWDEARLQKMTARNQDLYRFATQDGHVFVIEDDLPRFLEEHKELKDENKILILGEDRLLSYTATEAVEQKMASGKVKDLDELYRQLGGDPATVLNLAPTSTEEMSWLLASWAPMLAALAVLFIIMELKTPGIGIWAGLAGVCGVLFFICQFYFELASYPEVLLVLFGVALIVVDLFFLPTGGILAMIGITMAMVGLVLAFMPDSTQFAPTSDGWGNSLTTAFGNSLMALLFGAGGLIALILALPKLAVAQKLASMAEITATSSGDTATAITYNGAATGQHAVARSDLSPNGFILVEDREIGATAEHGQFIKAGTPVIILSMQFGEALVRVNADHMILNKEPT